MSTLDRRSFMKRSAGALAASWALAGRASAQDNPTVEHLTAATPRKLGNTGITCSLLGLGTGMRGSRGSSDLTRQGRKAALDVFAHAYARGITYFDLADMYGSHGYMREMLEHTIPRDKAMIVTKSGARGADYLRADLDRFRLELDVDTIDVVLLHCLGDGDCPNWPEKLKPCMDVLSEAKEKGYVRAHGVSCHSLNALKEAAACPWVDVMLSRINPAGERMDATPEEVVPVLKQAHAAGKGMLGMKIVGEGTLKDRVSESLAFVLSLGCIDAITIGFQNAAEIDDAVQRIDAVSATA